MGELLYAIIHRKSRSNANIFYKQGKTLGAMQIPSTAYHKFLQICKLRY